MPKDVNFYACLLFWPPGIEEDMTLSPLESVMSSWPYTKTLNNITYKNIITIHLIDQ